MLSRCVDWNFIQAKQALARGTLRKTLSLSWNVCKLVLGMDLEPLISHQFHYCVQRTSTYFNVTMAKMEGFKLHLGPPAVSPKPTWATRQNTCHLSHSKCSNPQKQTLTLRLFDLTACTVARCCHDELWDSQTAATRPPRRRAIPPVADELVTFLHHLSHLSMSLNTSLQYKTCSKLIKSRLHIRIWMHSRHSDDAMWYDMDDAFWFSDFTSWKMFIIQVSLMEMKMMLPKAQAFTFRVAMQNPLNLSSSLSRILNLDWTNQDEFIEFIIYESTSIRLSRSSRKTGAKWVTWPGSDPLDELDQFIFSLEWRWVKISKLFKFILNM